jgi:hypothetical protein
LRAFKRNNKVCLEIIVLFVLALFISGCAPKTDYLSYEDQKEKGVKVFNKDLQFCQKYSNTKARQIEGSKGAGERFNQKNSIFLLCMKNKDWILKE